MENIQSKLSVNAMTAYIGIFKEPRGIIRLLQFIFAICAFATACNGGSSVSVNTPIGINTVSASWSYPYNLQNTPIQVSIGSGYSNTTISSANDVKPSAQFFVFTGVTSMLLSLAFVVVYIIMDRQYRNDERFPIADFIITIVWSIFWIAGSSAWAQGVSNIRAQTSWDKIGQRSGLCPDLSQCSQNYSGAYPNIIVSVLFGFLNFILWVGCAWFVYKETKFFKSRTAQQQPQAQQTNFSNMGSPPMQQQQQPNIRPPMQQQPNIRPPGTVG